MCCYTAWVINRLADRGTVFGRSSIGFKQKFNRDDKCAIRSFEQFLILLKENLNRREFRHFPYLLKCDFKKFINEIEIVEREIHATFGEFNNIEGISTFINNPFISNKISKLFDAN